MLLYQVSDYRFEEGAVVFSTVASREQALRALGNADPVLIMSSGDDVRGLEPRWSCQKEGARGRFGRADVALLAEGGHALLHLRALSLCTLKSEVVSPNDAIAVFQKEVLDPVGRWQRR